MAISRPRNEVELEIKETLGIVPSFFNRIPDSALDFEWELFRKFELEEAFQTNGLRLPAKVRQLIGVAVHSETKCEYCTLFHQELAKFFGASDEEIQEAVHYAKHTVGWSVYLNGIREPLDRFEQELGEIGGHLGRQQTPKAKAV